MDAAEIARGADWTIPEGFAIGHAPTTGGEDMPVINASSLPNAHLVGDEHGATISLILDRSQPGDGPRLHRHSYDETWVVIDGNIVFQAGEDELEAGPGDIVIVPPLTPHKFTNSGPRQAHLVCIHANPRFETEWLE
jgi:mannose-6-phosphate isomerase-like protein (cupin superfamily)